MRLKYLSIKNFRGIKKLCEVLDQPLVCLVGPSDSTKTTVLDAIEIALSLYSSSSFSDLDFYDCRPDQAIDIEVGVSDVPATLFSD